jgi:hypothetical protein
MYAHVNKHGKYRFAPRNRDGALRGGDSIRPSISMRQHQLEQQS